MSRIDSFDFTTSTDYIHFSSFVYGKPFRVFGMLEFLKAAIKYRHQLDCYLFSMIRNLSLLQLLYDCLMSGFLAVVAIVVVVVVLAVIGHYR